jgi:hypothetical protein
MEQEWRRRLADSDDSQEGTMNRLLIPVAAAGVLATMACGGDSSKASAAGRPRETAALSPIDACTLLTKEEAEAITGRPLGAPAKGGSGECHYGKEGSFPEIILAPVMLAFGSKEEFHAFVAKDTKNLNDRMKEGLKNTGMTVKEVTVDPVAGVGDAAFYVEPSLVVLKHGRVLNIVAADRKQAVAVAARAIPRFQ